MCQTCPASSYSIPAMGEDEEKPDLNAQTWRDSFSLQSQGEEFGLGKTRGPALHFLYPSPPDSSGLCLQALAPGEAAGAGQLRESTVHQDGPDRQSQELI